MGVNLMPEERVGHAPIFCDITHKVSGDIARFFLKMSQIATNAASGVVQPWLY
jgi:hypothetical protein